MQNCHMYTNESWTRVSVSAYSIFFGVSEQAYVLYMIFTQNLAIGHLNSPKICAAAEKLRCIENYFAIGLWLPETKSNQILRIPTPTPKLARSPPYLSLPISSSHFFLFSCSISIFLSLSVTQSPQPESGGSAWGDVVCVTGCEMSVTLTGLSGYLTACRLIASSFRLNEGAGHKSFLCGCMVVFAVYIDLVKLKEYHTPQKSKRSSFSHPYCSKPVKCHW